MACWSAENATKAYLRAIKMGKRANEPDISEFISALAAGNNAKSMVVACGGAADSAIAGLVAAAQQIGGEVVCILPCTSELQPSKQNLGESASHVNFIIGNAEDILKNVLKHADCIVVDCNLKNYEEILGNAKGFGKNVLVLGYNAYSMTGSRRCKGLDAYLLPIGEGLLVGRTGKSGDDRGGRVVGKKSRWVVKVDKCTGEEHVFRVRN